MESHMKNGAAILLVLALTVCAAVSQVQTQQELYETLYQKWHDLGPRHLEPGFWYGIKGPSAFASVVTQIESNKIGMAYFLCEKMAKIPITNVDELYVDVHLLWNVAGVDLIYPEKPLPGDENYFNNTTNIVAKFQEEWAQGIYKDPSQRIQKLCQGKLAEESGSVIDTYALIALRRYGIFGLPELINEIKRHNSKHAFEAYLIITSQVAEYDDYYYHNDRQFVSKEAKLEHVKKRWAEMKSRHGTDDFDISKKITAALAN